MPTINQLSSTDTLSDGDQFFVYKQSSGDARKVAASVISDYIAPSSVTDEYLDIYESPSSSGFTVVIPATTSNVNLYLTPVAAYASGAVTLPIASGCINNQTVSIFTTQQITAFTVNANGAIDLLTVPASLAENSGITLRFNAFTWYRIA